MSELFLFNDLLKLSGLHEEERKLYHFSGNKKDQDFFYFLGFLESALAGESAEKTKYKYHYKHFQADNVQQTYLRTYYENLAREENSMSKIIIPYVLNIENKTVVLKKKMHRHMKWKILQLHRESQAVDQLSKFKMWHVIVKFCIDFVTGRITRK